MIDDTSTCEGCDKQVSWKMAQVTMNKFRKVLCFDCQEVEIRATYPPKLREYALRQLEQYKQ